MLQQGMLLEEIHLLLDGNLRQREKDICKIFAPIFAPFPGVVFTPRERLLTRAREEVRVVLIPKKGEGNAGPALSIFISNPPS